MNPGKHVPFLLALLVSIGIPSRAKAGSPEPNPLPPSAAFGLGWYGAIDGGVNAYQSYPEVSSFGGGGPVEESTYVQFSRERKIGGFGGVKLGYVFGTGVVRLAMEEDLFYNGFQSSVRTDASTLVMPGGPPPTFSSNSNVRVNSGGFLTNFILRFAPGSGRLQPYLGVGIGGYYASTGKVSLNFNGENLTIHRSTTNTGFAWQAIGGADYYLNPKFSVFVEYRYLTYNDLGSRTSLPEFAAVRQPRIFGTSSIGQSLVGAGVRFHF